MSPWVAGVCLFFSCLVSYLWCLSLLCVWVSVFPAFLCMSVLVCLCYVLLFWGIGFVLCMGSQVLCGSGFCVFGVVFGVLGCVGGRFFVFWRLSGVLFCGGGCFFGLIFLFG